MLFRSIRLALIWYPFQYVPDIYYYDKQATEALASGVDPYGHAYAVPAWLLTQGAENVFAYLPGVLPFLLPFGVLTDVRVGLVVCDIIVACCLWSLGGRRSPTVAAAFLFVPPLFLFSTWYPNNALIAMAFLSSSILLESRRNYTWSGLFLGLTMASNQFVWLVFPFLALRSVRGGRSRDVGVSLLVASLVVLPFVLWDLNAFWSNVVAFPLSRQPQSLLTPEPFGFNVNLTLSGLAFTLAGSLVPSWARIALVAGPLVLFLSRSSKSGSFLLDSTLLLLLGVLVLPTTLSLWYLELPLLTFLAWLALPSTTAEPSGNP